MNTKLSNNKINYILLKNIYHGLANYYIDTIKYYTGNDLRIIQKNPYYSSKNFYRHEVFKLTGYYFLNDIAKKIYENFITFYSVIKIKNKQISKEEVLSIWEKKYFDSYLKNYNNQEIDEIYTFKKILIEKLKKIFNNIFKKIQFNKLFN